MHANPGIDDYETLQYRGLGGRAAENSEIFMPQEIELLVQSEA